MNRTSFGADGCEKTRKYLDSYISNELTVETTHEVLRHLDTCPECSAELNVRLQMRAWLKSAVKSQSVPPELQVRIREQMGKQRSGAWFNAGWTRWAAAAAALVAAAGLWLTTSRETLPALADRAGQAVYIQKASATLAGILKVGLGDHIHCSVFRKYPQNPPPVEQMEEKLGASFRGLLPVVRTAVPDGYRIIMAHQCNYAGRKYIHLTLEKNGELVSLVVARKNAGESLAGLAPAPGQSGAPIYQSGAGRYQVAGFEAGDYLAFVVSDLKSKVNLQIASHLAPGVREFLIHAA